MSISRKSQADRLATAVRGRMARGWVFNRRVQFDGRNPGRYDGGSVIHTRGDVLMRAFTAVIERCPETGLFVGYVPGFPGAHSQGETQGRVAAKPGRGHRDAHGGRRTPTLNRNSSARKRCRWLDHAQATGAQAARGGLAPERTGLRRGAAGAALTSSSAIPTEEEPRCPSTRGGTSRRCCCERLLVTLACPPRILSQWVDRRTKTRAVGAQPSLAGILPACVRVSGSAPPGALAARATRG